MGVAPAPPRAAGPVRAADAAHPPSGWRAGRLDRASPRGLRATLVAVAVVLVAVPFTALLVSVEVDGPLLAWDQDVADGLNRWAHRSEPRVQVARAVSLMGWPPVLAAWVVLGAGWAVLTGRARLAGFLVATAAVGAVVQVVLKAAVARPRPEVVVTVATARGDSFPSGHAMASTVVYGALLLVVAPLVDRRGRRALTAAALLLVAAIGTSRLVLGVHFLTDVVAGHVAGLAWLAAAAAVFQVWRLHQPPDLDGDALGVPDEPEPGRAPT